MNFLPYQQQILTAYLEQFDEDERIKYIQAFKQFPDEQKQEVLQDFATQLPELQPLVQQVMGQEEAQFGFGGLYQDGGRFDDMSPEEQTRLIALANENDTYYGQERGEGFDYPMYDSTFGEPETRYEIDPSNPNRRIKVPIQTTPLTNKLAKTQRFVKKGLDISPVPNRQTFTTPSVGVQVPSTANITAEKEPMPVKVKRSNTVSGSDDVRRLQEMLYKSGYLTKPGNTKNGKWDGIAGTKTKAALTKYLKRSQSAPSVSVTLPNGNIQEILPDGSERIYSPEGDLISNKTKSNSATSKKTTAGQRGAQYANTLQQGFDNLANKIAYGINEVLPEAGKDIGDAAYNQYKAQTQELGAFPYYPSSVNPNIDVNGVSNQFPTTNTMGIPQGAIKIKGAPNAYRIGDKIYMYTPNTGKADVYDLNGNLLIEGFNTVANAGMLNYLQQQEIQEAQKDKNVYMGDLLPTISVTAKRANGGKVGNYYSRMKKRYK